MLGILLTVFFIVNISFAAIPGTAEENTENAGMKVELTYEFANLKFPLNISKEWESTKC